MRKRIPGVLAAVGLAAVGWLVAELIGALGVTGFEPLVMALIVGMALRLFVAPPRTLEPGLVFASRTMLEFGIVLLGASLNFCDLGTAGIRLVSFAVTGVVLTLVLAMVIGRALGLPTRLSALVGIGNAICGNSAIAAVAPVIRATKQEIASAIALTAGLSVGVVLLLPPLAPLFGLSDREYGVVAGLSVYAVPQVLAATLAVSTESGEYGTLVKLVRVLLLGPVVAGAAIVMARQRSTSVDTAESSSFRLSKFVPWFVIGFFGLALLRTSSVVPETLGDLGKETSRWLTVIAMAALGFSVDLRSVRATGPRVAALVLGLTVFLIMLGVVLVKAFGVS